MSWATAGTVEAGVLAPPSTKGEQSTGWLHRVKARIAAMDTGSAQPFDLEATKAKMAETRLAMDILLDRVQEALLAGLINYAEAQD